ncbi:RraA family protein [Virgibacillus halophilus]|uniref:Putative 4-hydroxy-4-methyl-2-oxoglutarate aldolase n=1 Tax=Tigheibacillus halophilus TaxID=361280 RepID=A0ABU5C5S4_9BACI|nr:RraA family protein [Virgibacillus halophilus]
MHIIDQFQDIPTTCISDAMGGMGNLDSSIAPLKGNYRVAGRAFTVKMPVGDNLMVLQAIKEAKPGDVLVIDAKGDTYRAVAGDFILGMAQTMGIQGVIADGVIRDITGVKELNFPVFCRGTTVAASAKTGAGEVNVPISCAGVAVNPGDIVVGDADGVVVVPRQQEKAMLEKSIEKINKDEKREASVAGDKDKILAYLDDMLSIG